MFKVKIQFGLWAILGLLTFAVAAAAQGPASNGLSPNNPPSVGTLTFHGGASNIHGVQHSQKIYTIFWNPTATAFPDGYQTTINQFVQDLNGSSYYAIASQYGDSAGLINTAVSFGGTWLDTTNAIPDSLTNTALVNEVNRAKTANGWTSDAESFFLIYTPVSVTNSAYCGFHNSQSFPSVTFGLILFPRDACSPSSPWPNGQWIDAAINITSHEIMDTVTDPFGTGWYYLDNGGEISDLCNFNFGSRDRNLGSNVVLGGHPYVIQQEWSNASSSCVLAYGSSPPSVTGVSPDPVNGSASLQTITINGTGFINKPWVMVTWATGGRVLTSGEVTFLSSTQLQMSIITTATPDTWTVKVANPDGTASNTLSFSVGAVSSAPGAFAKTSPGNSVSGQSSSPASSWGASTGAVTYEYCIDTINNNSCDTSWTSTAGTSAAFGGLSAGVTYWWQVRAVNGGGATEANGGTWWSFKVATNVSVSVTESFESGALPPWSAFGTVNATISSSVARTGTSSLAESGEFGGVYQDLTGLTPGGLYQVTAYARSTPGAVNQALLVVHDTTGAASVLDGWRTPSSSGWEAFTVMFAATATGRIRIHLIASGGSGSIFWDDVHVADAGGFESGALPPWLAFGTVNATVTGSVVRSGISSLAETGEYGGVYQDFAGLTPGGLYQVTAYARSTPGAANQALLVVHDTAGAGSVLDGWRTPSSRGWDAFTVMFAATATGRIRIHLIASGGSGSIFWDDVHVVDAGSFESGALPPWLVFGTVNATATGSVIRSGISSLAETGEFGGVYQDFAGLTPGGLYQITAYARSTPGAANQALLVVHDTAGAGSVLDGWRTPSSSGWDAFTVMFAATATGRIRIHLIASGGSGSIFWDDVHVVDAGGFESGALPPWLVFGTGNATVTGSVVRSGISSLAETGEFGGVYQDLTGLTPGGLYQITAYARSTPGTANQALLFVHDTAGAGNVVDGWRTPSSNGWDAFTVMFTATATGRIRIHLISSGGSGTIFWDDVKVN